MQRTPVVESSDQAPELRGEAFVASLLATGSAAAREGAEQALALLAGGHLDGAAANLVAAAWHAGDVLGAEGIAPDSQQTWLALMSLLNSADQTILVRYPPSQQRTSAEWVPYWRGLAALVHSGAAATGDPASWRGSALAFVYLAGDHERPLDVARLALERGTMDTTELERLLASQATVGAAVADGVL